MRIKIRQRLLKQIARKFAVFSSSFLIILQSFAYSIPYLAQNAYAQEATTTATTDPSPTPSTSPTPTPQVSPTPEPTPTVKPTTTTTGNLQGEILNNTSATSAKQVVSDLGLTAEGIQNTDPSIITDKADYAPTDTAIITGTNFVKNATYTIHITSVDSYSFTTTITTNDQGSFTYIYQLDGTYRPTYSVEILGPPNNTVVATTNFTDSPLSVNANQCANGGVGKTPESCSGNNWVTGNVNGKKAHWQEGDFLPYRITINNVDAGSGSYTFSYDVTKAGKHAIDYLGDYDASETTGAPAGDNANGNNPCGDVTGMQVLCTPASPTEAVSVPAPVLTPFPPACGTNHFVGDRVQGAIKAWGLTGLSFDYITENVGSGDCTTTVKVSWTGTSHNTGTKNAVIAFGGHVAKKADWGPGNSAVSIKGSPYHVHQVALSVNGVDKNIGSQDLQLATSAITAPANITIVKTTVGGNGTFNYTATGNGMSNFNITTSGGNGSPNKDFTGLTAESGGGSRAIVETVPSGWALTGLACISLLEDPSGNPLSTVTTNPATGIVTVSNLAAGDTVTCTYTNTLQQAHLTVIKHVINDNGGSSSAGDWTMNVTATNPSQTSFSGSESGTSITIDAGSFSVAENGGPTGYTQTSAVGCTGTIAAGGSATCTITNDDIIPSLTLNKVVVNDNGGSAVAGDWTLAAAGSTPISGAGFVTSGIGFSAGTYALSESAGPAGYTPSAWTCTGGTQSGSNITVPIGQSATCQITNNDIAPTLTLVKTVSNTHGGTATTANFQGKIDSSNVPWSVAQVLSAGAHTASETNLPGYTPSVWDGNCATNGTITLNPGDNKTCTITNTDQPGTLIVKKLVINDDGGTKVAGDFKFNVNGGGDTAFNQVDPTHGQNNLTVNTGTYNVTEPTVLGYSASYDNCTNVVVPNGGSATCTITNNDIQPKLTVTKVVINNNGGTAVVANFPLFVDAGPVTSGIQNVFNAGTYTVSETNLPGYTGTISGDCDALTGHVTLAVGDVKACTITNNDNAPSLTLNKVVVNDNGGTALESAWTLSADGPTPISGPGGTGPTDVVSGPTFSAGTYTLGESTGPAGYDASSWTCTNGISVNGANQITLGLGQSTTCTITNNDQPAHIIVIKHVINNNGGSAVAGAFTTTISGVTTAVPSAAGVESPGVNNILTSVGSYSVDEGAHVGYDKTLSTDCSGTIGLGETKTCTVTNDDQVAHLTVIKHVINDNGGTAAAGNFSMLVAATNPSQAFFGGAEDPGTTITLDAGNYSVNELGLPEYFGSASADCTGTISVGESKTCTITNDDIAPALHLRKTVDNGNGGTATVADFTLTADGAEANDISGTSPVDSTGTLKADTFALSEAGPSGYSASAWTCVGGTQVGSNITLGLNQEATCTVTNSAIAPTLRLGKEVTNNNGGNAHPEDWTLTATGTGGFSDNGNSGIFHNVKANVSYVLGESTIPGYSAGSWVCNGGNQTTNNITLGLNQDVTCTITNDDIAPTITLTKVVNNNHGGTAGPNVFGISVGGAGVTSGVPKSVNANSAIALDEAGLTGYQFVSLTGNAKCPSVLGGTVTLDEGENVSCTITNQDIAPQLIVIKHVINDDNDVAVASDFTMHLTGTNLSNNDFAGSEAGVTVTLDAGAYTANEALNNGYVKSLSADCSGTIAVGETKTCTITNNDTPHATRTQGFWQAHTDYTLSVLGDVSWTIGGKTINKTNIFSAFYASISKKSDGKTKRLAIDQARMQMLQQWVAAQLNCLKFTCSTSTQTLLTNAATAWNTGTAAQILSFASQLDTYNNSNDALPISGQGKATPTASQTQASSGLSFWDVLP